jgi:hypothetical protein
MCGASAPPGGPKGEGHDRDVFSKAGLGTVDDAERPLPVDLLLRKLQKDGVCVLASQIPGLNPFEVRL